MTSQLTTTTNTRSSTWNLSNLFLTKNVHLPSASIGVGYSRRNDVGENGRVLLSLLEKSPEQNEFSQGRKLHLPVGEKLYSSFWKPFRRPGVCAVSVCARVNNVASIADCCRRRCLLGFCGPGAGFFFVFRDARGESKRRFWWWEKKEAFNAVGLLGWFVKEVNSRMITIQFCGKWRKRSLPNCVACCRQLFSDHPD